MKLPNGLVIGTCTVRSSTFFRLGRSTGPRDVAPVSGDLGLRMRWSVKMTSSAVRGLPSWNVTPLRSRMVHSEVEPCGLISSASTICVCAAAFSWRSGW